MTINISYDIESEARALSGCLRDIDWANEVFSHLQEFHFYAPKHRLIFARMRYLYENDRIVSVESINDCRANEGLSLEDILRVAHVGTSGMYLSDFIAPIKDSFYKRTLQEMGNTLVKESSSKLTSSEIIRSFEQQLFNLTQENTKKILISIKDLLLSSPTYLESIQERQQKFKDGDTSFDGFPTKFHDLDNHLKGLIPGHFTIIGARPGVGKTTFALNLIENLCFSSIKCLFFSLEMPANEIRNKLMAQSAEIPYSKIQKGDINGEQFQRLVAVSRAWENKILIIDDQPSLGIDQVKARSIRAKRNYGIEVIFIDYVQLVRSKGHESRHLEIGDISRRLKEISKELQIPIIALAQLNREVEKRTDKKPFISDLRESGSLEADADEIILLHRPELFDKNDKPGLMEVLISKNRFGPTGTFLLRFAKEFGKLYNYEFTL